MGTGGHLFDGGTEEVEFDHDNTVGVIDVRIRAIKGSIRDAEKQIAVLQERIKLYKSFLEDMQQFMECAEGTEEELEYYKIRVKKNCGLSDDKSELNENVDK